MDASAVTLNPAENSTGKLDRGESMDGVQCVEESAAIPLWTMDLSTISVDKSAAVVDKIVRSSRMRSASRVASDDLADSGTQGETAMIGCAQQADSFVQHALNITGTKAMTEHVDPSPFYLS